MCAVVVLVLVFFLYQAKRLATKPWDWLGECHWNGLFCVEWDV